MIDDMGIFRTTIEIANPAVPALTRTLRNVMVDTGAEYSSLPQALMEELGIEPARVDKFESADGRVFERCVGFVIVHAGARSGATVAMFAVEGDMTLLGAHGLEALNLRVDLVRKELVPAGPAPAAAAA
jgi:predicted aspartyl protease